MTTDQQTFLIVGAGLAGASAAEALRAQEFAGQIVLLGNETERPYNRPPLSKDYLQGKSEQDKIYVHPRAWYAERDVDVRLDTRVFGVTAVGHPAAGRLHPQQHPGSAPSIPLAGAAIARPAP